MTKTQVQITKPMLSAKTPDDLSTIEFPVYATAKLDGIRALMVDGKLVSRTFKPIRNTHIRTTLEGILPDGIDGELMAGTTFQDVASAIMRESGTPEFTYMAFDYVTDDINKPYVDRMRDLENWFDENMPENVILLLPKIINTLDELLAFESECLEDGFEGVMIRSADGPYKQGRATLREKYLTKIKQFKDAEAEVIGFEELMHNDNEALKDAFGRTKRSQHQENKRPAGCLGKFIVRDLETGVEFGIGTGLKQHERDELWADRENLVGRILTYKSFPQGVLVAPRHPVFLRWRLDAEA